MPPMTSIASPTGTRNMMMTSVIRSRLAAAGLADDAALLRMGSTFAATGVRRLQDAGRATHLDPDAVGETMARLFASFVLLPAQHAIDVRTQAGARDYSRRTLVPLLLG